MIYYGLGSDWGWEWALTPRTANTGRSHHSWVVAHGRRHEPREPQSHDALIQFVNSSKVGTNSGTSTWVAPLGQTPDYLDLQCQEALYEVDISGMELHFRGLEEEMIGCHEGIG